MLGFLSTAIAGAAVQASATANATAHKKKVFVDDALIFGLLSVLEEIK
jgi:hypothetical protein